jgi:hypothetical protein
VTYFYCVEVKDALVHSRTIPTLLQDFLVGKQRALMTAECTLSFGRGQELKPFFLLNSYVFQRPFSHVLAQ